MPSYAEKVGAHAEKAGLLNGEKVLAAAKVMVEDRLKAVVFTAAMAVAAGTAVPPGEERKKAGEFPSAPQMVLALTGNRLIIFRMSGMLARPREVLGELPVRSIESVRTGTGRYMGMPCGTLTLGIEGEREVELLVPRVQMGEARKLAGALEGLVGS